MNRADARSRTRTREGQRPSQDLFWKPSSSDSRKNSVAGDRRKRPLVKTRKVRNGAQQRAQKSVPREVRAQHNNERSRQQPKAPTRRPVAAPPPKPSTEHHASRGGQIAQHKRQPNEGRVQHELREMRETKDLREVDDDVEDDATLYEWYAQEHAHQPKSPRWFMAFAGGVTVVAVGFIVVGNIIAGITIGLIGGLMYYIAQHEPPTARYRILTEGVAINNTLYHFRDLASFNIVYEPGEVKTVILRSERPLAPLIHMEIGDADPVDIREILLGFVEEDQDLDEPLVDIWARRLGF